MKSALVTTAAATKLPRLWLLGLCVAYIVPGWLLRDPWKNDDAASFGIIWTMAQGTWHDWLMPNIAGLSVTEEGPLFFWIAALFVKLFTHTAGILPAPAAARCATVLMFVISTSAIWHATFFLAQRDEAQPYKLIFGAAPKPQDYARSLADGALLFYLACFGALTLSHETTSEVALLACCASFIWGVARSLTHCWQGSLLAGVALGAATLTHGYVVPCVLATAWLVFLTCTYQRLAPSLQYQFAPALPKTTRAHFLGIAMRFWACAGALMLGLFIANLWPLILLHSEFAANQNYWQAWGEWQSQQIAWPSSMHLLNNVQFSLKNLPWFTWPLWPFAVWACWSWRKQWRTAQLVLPTSIVLLLLLALLLHPHPSSSELLPLLPALAILAAFGLPTMKRGAKSAVDWFALFVSGIVAISLWLHWIAKLTGWPPQLAKNVFKLVEGLKPEFYALPFAIALIASTIWLGLVIWRIGRHRGALWRPVVLSSSGIVLVWVLLMTLWLPTLNYARSYANVANAMRLKMQTQLSSKNFCVAAEGLGNAQRASFAYFAHLQFGDSKECSYLLTQDNPNQKAARALPRGAKLIWEGRRPSDRDERFRLYHLGRQ